MNYTVHTPIKTVTRAVAQGKSARMILVRICDGSNSCQTPPFPWSNGFDDKDDVTNFVRRTRGHPFFALEKSPRTPSAIVSKIHRGLWFASRTTEDDRQVVTKL